MRVVVLSTETRHHTYFLNKLYPRFNIAAVVYERRRLKKDYPTGPFFADEEDAFEERFFDPALGGVAPTLPEELQKRVVQVHSVNQTGMAAYLAVLAPDIGITFGVGRVKPDVFAVPRWGTINVHRGIPQDYRGLDSDLWAIYEGRFDKIGVTVHYVDADLDTGPVLLQERVPILAEDEIFHLRYKTSVVATRMVMAVLERMEALGGPVRGVPQSAAGPYYTAMPLEKKVEALRRFEDYKRSLRRRHA